MALRPSGKSVFTELWVRLKLRVRVRLRLRPRLRLTGVMLRGAMVSVRVLPQGQAWHPGRYS